MTYIDSCVLVAYYSEEALSAVAEKAVRNAYPPCVTHMTEVEFCSALALKTRTGKLDAVQAEEIIDRFRQHFLSGYFEILSVESAVYRMACDWISSLKTSLRTMDAIHLAIAHRHQIPILTSDRPLASSAKLLGCDCRLIG